MKPKSKTKVVNISDIKRAIGMKGPIGTIIGSFAMRAMGFCKINSIYSNFAEYYGQEFTEKALENFNIKYDIRTSELSYIPTEGPFIIVSNHPFGGWDGIILYNTIAALRPDFKILTNFVLSHIPNLKDSFLPVNPFSNMQNLQNSFSGVRAAKELILSGGCLGLFPAGEVSTYHGKGYTEDKEWSRTLVKFIKNCNVPVIPVYFDGSNSKKFHALGKIHPMLRTISLPRELLSKMGKTITMRIGRPITVSELSEFTDTKELGNYLRNRTYALEALVMKRRRRIALNLLKEDEEVPIALPRDRKSVRNEIAHLDKESKLYELGNYTCYLASYEDIPSLMYEIGRKREESFRAVGEGTGSPIDTDKYDKYYKHLILWDKQKKALAGAYRLGIGSEIMDQYGSDGFYTQSLFNYSKKFNSHLSETIELGRSFVSVEYQKEALPLMLLIRGLMYCVLRYDQCKYLMGPVSITSWYPLFFRSMIIYYIRNKHSASHLSKYVKAKHPFTCDFGRVDADALLANKMDSIEKFDRFMFRLSDNEFRMPTLVKKYLKLGSTILNFNVDKNFNYCVDGLILLKLTDIPEEEIQQLSKDSDRQEFILKRFGYGTGS